MHGGKSRRGWAHPNYQHGFYSKHDFWGLVLRHAAKQAAYIHKRDARIAGMLERERLAREAREACEAGRRSNRTWNIHFLRAALERSNCAAL